MMLYFITAPLHASLSSGDSGLGRSSTSYHSSTLPSQRRRARLSSEDKRSKVIESCVSNNQLCVLFR